MKLDNYTPHPHSHTCTFMQCHFMITTIVHMTISAIRADRDSIMATHSIYVPPTMFNLPMPPHHYIQVGN